MVNFEVSGDINANGTSFMGTIYTTYDHLVKALGEPCLFDGDKTTVEWRLQVIDSDDRIHVACVYDWKETETPMAPYNWHIGARTPEVVNHVTELLDSLTGS